MKILMMTLVAALLMWCVNGENKAPDHSLKEPIPVDQNISQKSDTTPLVFFTIMYEGHKVPVQLRYTGRKRMESLPRTYLLKNGKVVHSYSNSLNRTPDKGKEWIKITEAWKGALLYTVYGGEGMYNGELLPARPMLLKLEYYDSTYSKLRHTFEFRKHNPYTKDKNPKIEFEEFFDAEAGFARDRNTQKPYKYWTQIDLQSFDNQYIGISYQLHHRNKNNALIKITSTLIVVNADGQVVFRKEDMDMQATPSLVTQDGRYFVVQYGLLENTQNFSDKVENEGFRIYDLASGDTEYEEQAETPLIRYDAPYEYHDAYVRISKTTLGNESVDRTEIIFNLNNRIKYEKRFTEEEIKESSKNWRKLDASSRGLLDFYQFSSKTF